MSVSSIAVQCWSLIKPRIVALLCLTGTSGVFAAGGAPPAQFIAFLIAGGGMAAGAATLNCYYDRDLDRLMERTRDRPLPSGQLHPRVALGVGVVLLAVGTVVGTRTLPTEAVTYMWLGAISYVGLYTVLLKRRHWMGVVLGGSAGSFPVLAGWVTVRPLGLEPLLMALVVFAWTPAHAWALASVYRTDFAAAGVPTLPVVADERRVRRAVWVSAVVTVGVAALLLPLGGVLYAGALVVAAPVFLFAFRRFHRNGSKAAAVRAFFTSNLFVAVVFVAWAADGFIAPERVPAVAVAAEMGLVVALFVRLWCARLSLGGVPTTTGGESGPLERLIDWLFADDHPN